MPRENPILTERTRLGLTQRELADDILHCSLRTVTELERASTEEAYERSAFKRHLAILQRIPQKASPESTAESPFYSWHPDVFSMLKSRLQVPNRAEKVLVEVDLEKGEAQTEDGKPLASHGMRVTYSGLVTDATPDGLLIDAVSRPGTQLHVTVENPFHDRGGAFYDKFVQYLDRNDKHTEYATVEGGGMEFRRLKPMEGHIGAYQLRGMDPEVVPELVLNYSADGAAVIDADEPDAMGFAVPSDLLLGSIEVRVRFWGMRPTPHPSSMPFPIRRYARAAVPQIFKKGLVMDPLMYEQDESRGMVAYRVEVARPKPGYGYVISWLGLEMVDA